MQKFEDLIHLVSKQGEQILFLKEDNQRLKDEIAVLKGQKSKPKIAPSSLEGSDKKEK